MVTAHALDTKGNIMKDLDTMYDRNIVYIDVKNADSPWIQINKMLK
jgi:hypothetical protein